MSSRQTIARDSRNRLDVTFLTIYNKFASAIAGFRRRANDLRTNAQPTKAMQSGQSFSDVDGSIGLTCRV